MKVLDKLNVPYNYCDVCGEIYVSATRVLSENTVITICDRHTDLSGAVDTYHKIVSGKSIQEVK